MQYSLKQLQEERSKILFLLQEEREKVVVATDRMEEHLELQVQQQLKQRERELQEHFYEQTEALQHKVQSLQEALEVMRKNEDIADFDMTSDGITMPLLKTAFMQLQVENSFCSSQPNTHPLIKEIYSKKQLFELLVVVYFILFLSAEAEDRE